MKNSRGGGEAKSNRAKVALQALFYLKNIQKAGELIPSAIVVADRDEAFIIPAKILTRYLNDSDVNWSVSPSKSYLVPENFEFFQKLIKDNNLNRYVENIVAEDFDVESFCQRVNQIAIDQEIEKIKVDHHTLEKAFEEFQRVVFGGQVADPKVKIQFGNEKKSLTYTQVQIFIMSLLGSENIFLSPNKKNEIIIIFKDYKGEEKVFRFPPSDKFTFFAEQYELFFNKYDRKDYSLEEKKKITEIADTLLEEFSRRYSGDFWTPTIWADEAHKLIEDELGIDWKEKYVVWDPACGTKNLTRDYRFKELYCSTLHQDELNISENYNPEAITFQYNFLNDDMGIHQFSKGLDFGEDDELSLSNFKLPEKLIQAMKSNKPIVFFSNPPYGQHTTSGTVGADKGGIANTKTQKIMGNLGSANKELYTQFIYRVQLFAKTFNYTNDFHFFFFNKGFLTAKSFSKFNDQLLDQFTFKKGFMLNAGEFKGTSSSWGIIFSHWEIKNKEAIPEQKQTSFDFIIKESSKNDGSFYIKDTGKWVGKRYNPSTEDLCDIQPSKIKRERLEKNDYPITSNGFDSKNESPHGYYPGSFGFLRSYASNVQQSGKFCQILSMAGAHPGGTTLQNDNFVNSMVAFSIRKSWWEIISEQDLLWVRDKDIFSAPTQSFQDSEEWKSFSNECVIYSLFASGSNQTSLREYGYNNKKWNIKNEFFWISKEKINELAIKNNNVKIQQDIVDQKESFVYSWLRENEEKITPEGNALLEISTKILEESFKYRDAYCYEEPKYQLNTWDSGWLQIYKMCFSRDSLPAAKNNIKLQNLYEDFKKARKILGNKIAKRYSEDTGF